MQWLIEMWSHCWAVENYWFASVSYTMVVEGGEAAVSGIIVAWLTVMGTWMSRAQVTWRLSLIDVVFIVSHCWVVVKFRNIWMQATYCVRLVASIGHMVWVDEWGEFTSVCVLEQCSLEWLHRWVLMGLPQVLQTCTLVGLCSFFVTNNGHLIGDLQYGCVATIHVWAVVLVGMLGVAPALGAARQIVGECCCALSSIPYVGCAWNTETWYSSIVGDGRSWPGRHDPRAEWRPAGLVLYRFGVMSRCTMMWNRCWA